MLTCCIRSGAKVGAVQKCANFVELEECCDITLTYPLEKTDIEENKGIHREKNSTPVTVSLLPVMVC